MNSVSIIGAGASGIVAAITAARAGSEVTLIDRQNRIGKKILVTGNGRCNLTNQALEDKYFHTQEKIAYLSPIHQIGLQETLSFFEDLGIVPLIEQNKVYPLSEQASSVVDVLREEIERLNIKLILECEVTRLYTKENKWHIVSHDQIISIADKVIVATGGMAAPQLGCDKTGYKLLESVGHTCEPVFPTLVHVLSPSKYCKMMQGTRIKAEVSIYQEEVLKRKEYGEVLFTEDGLSGPAIFQVSRIAAKSFKDKQKCYLCLDLFKDQSEEDLITMIYQRIGKQPTRTIEGLFIGWVHKRVAVPLIKAADIGSVTAACVDLEYEMILKLAKAMKALKFEVTGTRNFKFAQATAGGIRLKEVDLETMASKCVPHLYITGEVLDVDGDCGGYNLQWAWSTGILAGRQASK